MALKPIVTRDDFNVIGQFLVQELAKELTYQKHIATGKLIDSLEYRVKATNNGIRLEIWAEDYGKYVNDGRRAGAKKVPIAALIEWIKVKGIASGDKEVKSIAFAIQTKIYREGIPTQGSKRIAARRTAFVDLTIKNNENRVGEILETHVQDNIRRRLNKQFDEASRELKQAA